MDTKTVVMKKKKTIALVAHDNRKKDMIEWVTWNWKELAPHRLACTGTTGNLVLTSTPSGSCFCNNINIRLL